MAKDEAASRKTKMLCPSLSPWNVLFGLSRCLPHVAKTNKKAVLSQGNRAMPQVFFFGVKFADNIHHKFKSSQASKARLQSSKQKNKTEFNAKWPFKVIQDHVFWSEWKGDKTPNNTKYRY